MKVKLLKLLPGILLLTFIISFVVIKNKEPEKNRNGLFENEEEEENEEREAAFSEARTRYEFDLLKDPVTGKIPAGIFEKEIAFAKTLPVKGFINSSYRLSQTTVLNTYLPAGPNNVGGRTRALAYDLRYNGSTNRVVIAGCVSGGIMRSTDGGSTWAKVTPEGDIHSFTIITQDPRAGFQDTWYAGGGEPYGNTASELGAVYLGFGIWKSTNNGASWTKLPLTNITDINGSTIPAGTLESFDHPFDYVHKIAVNPSNGDVYVAGHRRLLRSKDGGSSFQTVFGSSVAANSDTGQMDVVVNDAGRILLAVNGGNPDRAIRGVWVSATGNTNSFSRIAGGQTLGADSVTNWRANSYNGEGKRILLALAPSNQNVAYVYYENGLSSDAPNFQPEADFFRLDISGNTFTWSNRSANMPDFPGNNLSGSDPLTVQNGYDMVIMVKPNDPNAVFIGGTNLYRSTDGFASTSNTAWINGYNTNFSYNTYPNGHADIHSLSFNPSDNKQAICGNDGGIQITNDITAASVSWNVLPNYQTLQYYYVSIDPGENRNNFAGGAMDNGVWLRDKIRILNTLPSDSNNHIKLNGGDGCSVGISHGNGSDQYVYASSQYGTIKRIRLSLSLPSSDIRPNNLTTASPGSTDEYGEFVTNFRLDPDNTEDLYYVNFNRLFRTNSASTVTSSTWTELIGVGQTVNPSNPTSGRNASIRALEFSRGAYSASHSLYIGTTDGKILRLDDPRNAAPGKIPVNITPSGLNGNVQSIAVNPENDNEVLAVVTNFNTINIWWTNTAKSAAPTWFNAEGNLTLPSIRSCAIAVKKDAANNPITEYYVGTQVGLYSTVDLSTTLTAGGTPVWVREGADKLNLAVVQSMALRPSDNVLLVGTHGNGMYYTFLNEAVTPVDSTGKAIFITQLFPTINTGIIDYKIGNLTNVKNIVVRVFNTKGQLMFKEERAYENNFIDIRPYASGVYIVNIVSSDGHYKYNQKVIKQP